jgi:hypothetical protein
MLSTFTTEYGTLIIRTQDIREIADVEDGCLLSYWLETRMATARIQGTARENLDRLKAEELDAIAQAEARQLAAQQAQQRVQQGYPPIPILRGGKLRG